MALANDYSYADRIMNDYDDHAVRRREGQDYSQPRSPRDVTHILALHYAWWEHRMRDNGKEDARKRGGGADKRGGGGAFTIPILSMWKNRGGGGGG